MFKNRKLVKPLLHVPVSRSAATAVLEQVSSWNQLIRQRRRSPTVEPSVKKTPASRNRGMVWVRGTHHQVLFYLEDLQAPNAIETMVEEFADQNMGWAEGVRSVYRILRESYRLHGWKGANSLAAKRRDQGMDFLVRLLEFLELMALKKEIGKDNYDDDDGSSIDAKSNPPFSTNLYYWRIRNVSDWKRVYDLEFAYFKTLKHTVIFQQIHKFAPWFYERGHHPYLMLFLMRLKYSVDIKLGCPDAAGLIKRLQQNVLKITNYAAQVGKLKNEGDGDSVSRIIIRMASELNACTINFDLGRKPNITVPDRLRMNQDDNDNENCNGKGNGGNVKFTFLASNEDSVELC